MLVIQQQIDANLQPHKKYSIIIADVTYDSRKREATVFVTGESHTFGDLLWNAIVLHADYMADPAEPCLR